MKELLEAGVHIGHTVERWNPKMKKFVYGTKEGIHIIDIIKTLRYLHYACTFLQSAATVNKSILFVGTKSTASEVVPLASKECNAFYIKQRWLGGFLTNWCTMKKCIQKLQQLDNDLPTQETHHKDGNINDESGILSEVVQRKALTTCHARNKR
jgi:small subunit ribosomal protein S2